MNSFVFAADGRTDGPPSLFPQNSMQKLRHCCQNLNLFPYLLYAFGNPKATMPMMKVNMCIGLFLARITERIIRVYSSMTQTIINGLGLAAISSVATAKTPSSEWLAVDERLSEKLAITPVTRAEDKPARKFEKFVVQKPKDSPLFLKLAVYFAPLVLAFQLVGIMSLMVFGKYTPGFIFLVSALLFLGYISMKVLSQDTAAPHTFKREKRKVE